MNRHDVVFVGSSPDTLVAAALLAKRGRRVCVLEAKERAGGPAATETFAPGFRADIGLSSLALDPEVVRELSLASTALEPIKRNSVTALGPTPLTLRAMPELPPAISEAIDVLRAIHRADPVELIAAASEKLNALSPRSMHEVLRLTFISAREQFEHDVASESTRALLAGVAVRALSEGPFSPGTLYNFLHHAARGDALFRGTAKGGVGAIATMLKDAALRFGADVRLGVGAHVIEVEDGIARGVRLASGERVAAEVVVSDHDLRRTFTELISPVELDPEVNRAVRRVRYRGSVARVHLALRELPRFEGVGEDALKGTLVSMSSLASIERAWDEAKRGALPKRLYVEATLPSLDDPTLAPEGQHVLDAWVQYVPRNATTKEAVLAGVLAELSAFAPRLSDLVIAHRVSLPEDLEKRFGCTEGHLYGGELRLEQSFFLRGLEPMPIPNLYLVGSAAHPGGHEGRSGLNLARRVSGD